MPDPIVVQIIDEYRRQLLNRESVQFENMTNRWLQTERALEGQVSALAFEIDRMRAAGETISDWRLQRLDRYQSLLAQAQGEVGRYAQYANDAITAGQVQYGMAGAELAQMILDTMGIRGGFDMLPIEAIEAMAGLTADGSPLLALLQESWPDAAAGLTDKLMQAIAMGQNPRVTARQMMDGLANGLNRMLTIVRTEQLRSYREATREQYKRSGVVMQYKRIAARQTRTCFACLMQDGQVYDLEDSFEDHPNGRCALIPIVKGMPEVEWTKGREFFSGLSEADQRAMMGAGKFDAWKAGKISLDDMVGTHQNDIWGNSPRIKSNKELGLGLSAQELERNPAWKSARIFDSDREARGWGEIHTPEFEYQSNEDMALHAYTDEGYKYINYELRDMSQSPSKRVARMTGMIDNSMSVTNEPIITYRAMRDFNLKPGEEFTDYGFVSTTLSESIANSGRYGDKAYSILVPRGTRAVFPGTSSLTQNELEFILGRGIKFRVISETELEVIE